MYDEVDVCPVSPTAKDVTRAASPLFAHLTPERFVPAEVDELVVDDHCELCGEYSSECVCTSQAFAACLQSWPPSRPIVPSAPA